MLAAVRLRASAQQRIALVIGNAAYPKGPLANSLADGGLVAEALTSIGFEIVEGADVNQATCAALFREFLDKVQAAGPDAIAFVYYSGYAVQFEGDNYLIPVDARLDRDSDIPIEACGCSTCCVRSPTRRRAAKIVILDATRPLPFQIQGGRIAPGLGAIEAAPGICWSRSRPRPAPIAPDGPGPYGAYATAIAEMVREPGLDIDTMFARIRLRTNEATNGAQTPWEVSQLQQGRDAGSRAAPRAPPPGAPQGLISAPQTAIGAPVVRRRPPPRPIQRDRRRRKPTRTRSSRTICRPTSNMCALYPNSPYAPRIWAMIRARREALLWRARAARELAGGLLDLPAALSGRDVCVRRAPAAAPAGRRGASAARLPHDGVRRCAAAARGRAGAALSTSIRRPRRRAASLRRRLPSSSACRRRRGRAARAVAPAAAGVSGDRRAARPGQRRTGLRRAVPRRWFGRSVTAARPPPGTAAARMAGAAARPSQAASPDRHGGRRRPARTAARLQGARRKASQDRDPAAARSAPRAATGIERPAAAPPPGSGTAAAWQSPPPAFRRPAAAGAAGDREPAAARRTAARFAKAAAEPAEASRRS